MSDKPSHFETVEAILSRWIRSGFKQAFGDAIGDTSGISVVETSSSEFGDYQCNDSMQFARDLKRSPRDIATAAAEAAGEHRAVERVDIAGPGFINIFLKEEWLVGYLAADDG